MPWPRLLIISSLLLGSCTLLTRFDEASCDVHAPANQQCLPGFVCVLGDSLDAGVCISLDGGTTPTTRADAGTDAG